MKLLNTFIIASALMAALCANGTPLTPEQALARAKGENQPARIAARAQAAPALAFTQVDDAGAPAVYVFNTPSQGGYMLLSADDCVAPILGYADSGFFDPDNLPPALQWWLEEYASQVQYSTTVAANATYSPQRIDASLPAIEPMIKTKWDQGTPFNNRCPLYGTSRTWTGCVATSIAQVMNYWQYPEKGTGNISYSCSSLEKRLTLNLANRAFDWDNMRLTYEPGSYTDEQADAVAYLMQAAGYSVKSEYGTYSTGALAMSVHKALKKYFGYNPNMQYAVRILYSSSQWESMMYENLRDCGPIIYGGKSYIGGGHSFICDGYDGNGFFHFNWGWSGVSDGYFALDAITPNALGTGGGGGGGYNFTQDAVLGIRPARSNDVEVLAPLSLVQHGTVKGLLNDEGQVLSISLEDQGDAMWVNYNNETMKVSFGLVFEPQDGQGEPVSADLSDRVITLEAGYGTGTLYFKNAIDLPALSLADGKYKAIMSILNEDDPDEGYIPVVPCYGYNSSFYLNKNGDLYTVENIPTNSLRIVEAKFLNTLYYAGVAQVSITLANDTDVELDGGFAPYLYMDIDDTIYPYFLGESLFVTVPAHTTVTKTWETSLLQMQQYYSNVDTDLKCTFFNEKTYTYYFDQSVQDVTVYANPGYPSAKANITLPNTTTITKTIGAFKRTVYVIPDRNNFSVQATISLASGSAPFAYETWACILKYGDSSGEILTNATRTVVIKDDETYDYEVDMAFPNAEADTNYYLQLAYIFGENIIGFGNITYLNFENGISGIDAPTLDSNDCQSIDNNIYNLLGQPMGRDLEHLPAGIYIQNGKKILKR